MSPLQVDQVMLCKKIADKIKWPPLFQSSESLFKFVLQIQAFSQGVVKLLATRFS